MADKMTTTQTVGADKAPTDIAADTDPNADVNAAIDNLREKLLATGLDETTVDAKLHGVRPPETNIVGNFADLQRLGAAQVGENGGIAEAFVPPATPPTAAEEASAGEVK